MEEKVFLFLVGGVKVSSCASIFAAVAAAAAVAVTATVAAAVAAVVVVITIAVWALKRPKCNEKKSM